jgi:rare lipoprotein A
MTSVKRIASVVVLAALSMIGCQAAFAECGIASYYTEGARTANGEAYNPGGISAAHRTLPFGSIVNVRNQHTGRSIQVRINDRGPFIGGRVIDLSGGARAALGMGGLAPVCLEVVSYGSGGRIRTVSNRGGRVRVASNRGTGVRVASARGTQRVRVARVATARVAQAPSRVRTASISSPAVARQTPSRGRYGVYVPKSESVRVTQRRRAVQTQDDD